MKLHSQHGAPQTHDLRTRLHATAEHFFAPSAAPIGREGAMAERIERLALIIEAMRADLPPAFECAGATPAQLHEIQMWIAHGADLVDDLRKSEET